MLPTTVPGALFVRTVRSRVTLLTSVNGTSYATLVVALVTPNAAAKIFDATTASTNNVGADLPIVSSNSPTTRSSATATLVQLKSVTDAESPATSHAIAHNR